MKNNITTTILLFVSAILLSMLVSCGGGGGDSKGACDAYFTSGITSCFDDWSELECTVYGIEIGKDYTYHDGQTCTERHGADGYL